MHFVDKTLNEANYFHEMCKKGHVIHNFTPLKHTLTCNNTIIKLVICLSETNQVFPFLQLMQVSLNCDII